MGLHVAAVKIMSAAATHYLYSIVLQPDLAETGLRQLVELFKVLKYLK
jgi:hypothetical protein